MLKDKATLKIGDGFSDIPEVLSSVVGSSISTKIEGRMREMGL